MPKIERWQSGASVLIALSMMGGVAAPIVATAPAVAQSAYQNQTIVIPNGTSIPVLYDKAQKIVVSPKETVPLTLIVAANVKSRTGTILIPAGSRIVGKLQPAEGGSQFIAEELVRSQGRRQYINATSSVITRSQEVRRGANTSSILKGAAIGGAAAAALSGLTGDKKISILEVLGGAGAGAAGGLVLGRKKVDVVVINPNTDLALKLRSDLALR